MKRETVRLLPDGEELVRDHAVPPDDAGESDQDPREPALDRRLAAAAASGRVSPDARPSIPSGS